MLDFFRRKPTKEQLARAKHGVDEVRAEQEASMKVMSAYKVDFDLDGNLKHIYTEMAHNRKDLESKVKKHYELFLKDKAKTVNPWVQYENGDDEGSFNLNYI